MSHFSLLGVPFLALKCQVLRVSHFPFLTSHFPFLIPYFLFPHFRREVVSTVSASNQKWDMRSWNSEVRNGNSEARNGNSEVRNGNQENSFPISQKASEKWEVGLKWEFPFSKYPPLFSVLSRLRANLQLYLLPLPLLSTHMPKDCINCISQKLIV